MTSFFEFSETDIVWAHWQKFIYYACGFRFTIINLFPFSWSVSLICYTISNLLIFETGQVQIEPTLFHALTCKVKNKPTFLLISFGPVSFSKSKFCIISTNLQLSLVCLSFVKLYIEIWHALVLYFLLRNCPDWCSYIDLNQIVQYLPSWCSIWLIWIFSFC